MTDKARVIIEILGGPLAGKKYIFDERTSTVAGRTADCNPRFPEDKYYQTISRHHCLIDMNPPLVRVRDMGSMNGTFVNGTAIGQRSRKGPPKEAEKKQSPEHELKDGDRLRLGEVELRVRIEGGGVETARGRDHCASCGTALPPAGSHPLDGVLCQKCRPHPKAALKALLAGAREGVQDLRALRGIKIEKVLGKGATGAVFLARRVKTGRGMALKVLLPEMAAGEWVVGSFLREVENTQVLKHENVVRLFHSGSYLGLLFYTMEYCDAGSLEDLRIKKGGRLPVKIALPMVLQALAGLDYVHNVELPRVLLADGTYGKGRGLVHRDLKPANIFLSRSGKKVKAKIADVGVGKAFDSAGLSGLTRTGSVAGTPVVSPRQQVINFKYARPDVDVWAMAATLYICLTGNYPRDFPQDKDPWRVVLETQPVPIRKRDPSIPEPLAEVIDRALIDNPEIEFKRAADLREALLEAWRKSSAG